MTEQEKQDFVKDIWDTATLAEAVVKLNTLISEAEKRAVLMYDSLVFDDDSCYKTAGVWKTKRSEALKKFGIEEE